MWNAVLLSLTSCGIWHQDIFVPIDPIPSTFDFPLGTSGRQSSSSLTNLYLAFDVSEARAHIMEDMLLATTPNPLGFDDEDRGPVLRSTPATNLSDFDRLMSSDIEDDNLSTTCKAVLNTRNYSLLDTSDFLASTKSNSHRDFPICQDWRTATNTLDRPPHLGDSATLDQELEVLQRVQAMIAHDAANLDCLVQVLSFVGVGLFFILIWSGYQWYRAMVEERRAHKLRTALVRRIRMVPTGRCPRFSKPSPCSPPRMVRQGDSLKKPRDGQENQSLQNAWISHGTMSLHRSKGYRYLLRHRR